MATVLAGSAAGLIAGSRLPDRIRETALQGVGLVTLVLGVREAGSTHNLTFPLGSVVVGGLIGEALRIEDRMESLGERLHRLTERGRRHGHGTRTAQTTDAPSPAGPHQGTASARDRPSSRASSPPA